MASKNTVTATSRFSSRKFLLSCYFAAAATAALFTGYLDGGEFVGITLAILSTHHIANYFDNKTSR